jgi:hypothetical protein
MIMRAFTDALKFSYADGGLQVELTKRRVPDDGVKSSE